MGWLFLCLCLMLFHFPSFSSSSFNFSCHPNDSSALLQFKSSFTIVDENGFYGCGYESHPKTATWRNGTDCCSWLGVTCDTVSGHVIGLNLGCEGLQGRLHPNSTLFRLPHLQTLDLSLNNFSSRSQLPSNFGRLVSLTHLNLSTCGLEGEIPHQISHLSKLVSLDLSWNDGVLASKETVLKRLVQNATILRELFLDHIDMSSISLNSMGFLFNQSSSLVTLSLRATGLRGNFKNKILCLPPGLQELYMSENYYLQGQLPELSCSSSTSLSILDLSYCAFQGPIPLSFSNLTHLTSLDLSGNGLNGSIPSSIVAHPLVTFLNLMYNDLSGQIPNVFHQSNRLQELHLSGNNIGGELPSSLSNLQHLIHLDLSSNAFSGQIPDVFGGLTKLQELHLNDNNLQGQVPSSLFNLTQLVHLDCSSNKLVGPLPNKITGFPNLTFLELYNNSLNGTIPSWCLSLSSLVELDLSNNQFAGHISAISSYSLLRLYLRGNKLQGNLPKSIFSLANLTDLDLSSNNLSGLVNFQLFCKLQNLVYLFLSQNSQLSLNFESRVNCNFSQLVELELSSMSLTEFPNLSGKFPTLRVLDLSNNKLYGRVPNWLLEMAQNMFKCVSLKSLDLSFNSLAGDIPLSICNVSSLSMLSLSHNKLTGTIPQCLANSSSLQILDLHVNKLGGTLPSIFSKDCQLATLNLNGNQLEGPLPKSLSNCNYLEVLDLGNNHIEDTFPHWLPTLQNLKVLVLRGNKLHGPIVTLKIKHPFGSLIIFDISCNNLSGPLPKTYLKSFEAMRNVVQIEGDSSLQYMEKKLGGSDYTRIVEGPEFIFYDSVNVTTKGNNMVLVKIPRTFVSIDLSRNKFEGKIPNVIGELQALKGLNLSHNSLSGPIPQSMGNLTNLESLDLSSNMITGGIPAELTNLNYLEVLNLSHNHLVGKIPQGKQFNTFSNDSYEGNLGLCGLPLTKKCGPEQQHSPPPPPNSIFWSEEKFGFGWEPVAIGYGCGVVFGVGLGCCVLYLGKPKWLVRMVGGQPNKRAVRRRTRMRRTRG